ncbi:hypothetical protein Hamer_G005946 [Homarus americanus]|uniref:Uncharacterized protein n=1 Tax=Homarus americanus TaxID=6706 RepID=A0A8J5JG22_HOMAM|nr:hypothetical protein Hamer_G005946 [Homarus americanus]
MASFATKLITWARESDIKNGLLRALNLNRDVFNKKSWLCAQLTLKGPDTMRTDYSTPAPWESPPAVFNILQTGTRKADCNPHELRQYKLLTFPFSQDTQFQSLLPRKTSAFGRQQKKIPSRMLLLSEMNCSSTCSMKLCGNGYMRRESTVPASKERLTDQHRAARLAFALQLITINCTRVIKADKTPATPQVGEVAFTLLIAALHGR